MRGIDSMDETKRPRPIVGRELEPASPRRQAHQLDIDRPCYIGRGTHGAWTWHCSLCPLPLRLVANPAPDWQMAIDEVTQHLRTWHPEGSQEPAATAESPLLGAA